MSSYDSHDSTSRSPDRCILVRSENRSRTSWLPNGIVTFNFEDALVYIKYPETHQEALALAKTEYTELANLPNSRISFVLDNVENFGRVRFSESAWPMLVLQSGIVINVLVLPDPDAKPPPPEYLELPQPKAPRGSSSSSSKSGSDLSLSLFSAMKGKGK